MTDDVTLTTITITRTITPDDDRFRVHVDGDDHLVTLLGLLEIAKDTVIRESMSNDTED